MALLVAGFEKGSGPVLYHTDPSGMFVEYDAKAIGSGSEGAQTVRSSLVLPPMPGLNASRGFCLHAGLPAGLSARCTVMSGP